MKDMSPQEILLAAADVIQQRGLYKGGWYFDPSRYQSEARVCTIGAISVAKEGLPQADVRYRRKRDPIIKRIMRVLGPNTSILDWNDEDGRTQDEVIQMLHDAARGTK